MYDPFKPPKETRTFVVRIGPVKVISVAGANMRGAVAVFECDALAFTLSPVEFTKLPFHGHAVPEHFVQVTGEAVAPSAQHLKNQAKSTDIFT